MSGPGAELGTLCLPVALGLALYAGFARHSGRGLVVSLVALSFACASIALTFSLMGWVRSVLCAYTAGTCYSIGNLVGAGVFAGAQGAAVLATVLITLRHWQYHRKP